MKFPLRAFGYPSRVVALAGLSALLLSGSRDWPTPVKADSQAVLAVHDPVPNGRQTYLNVPMVFEPNRGQVASGALYVARAAGYTLEIHPHGARMALRADRPTSAHVLDMDLANPLPRPAIGAEAPQPGRSSYIIGHDASSHLTDIPQFGRVVATGVYPGIDLAYYGRQNRLEYDFIVAPGADPGRIGLHFSGADSMTIDVDGDLVFRWGTRELRQHKPVVYELPGRTPVDGRFVIAADGTVGFSLGRRDRTKTLVIDPTLAFGSYLGGSDTDNARAVAVDGTGNIYVAGFTASFNFPTVAAYQATKGDSAAFYTDAFITKINAAGTAIVYSTYLGGSSSDEGYGIAVDATGAAYLAGYTSSSNFPTTSPLTTNCATSDAFLTKLTPAGNALSYSLCFGTGGTDRANAVSVDSASRAYVTGLHGATDAFVARLNVSGSAFDYYKVVGGSASGDEGFGIAADAAGNVCVTGATASTDFPTVNPRQSVFGGSQDAFAIKYDTTGSVVFATYLGGSASDVGSGAAIDGAGNCYVTGTTFSTNFPTANAAQTTNGGRSDAFVAAYNATGTAYLYSTYLGGAGGDTGWAIAATASGSVHVVGQANSLNFPVLNPVQAALKDIGAVHVSTTAGGSFSPTALAFGGDSVRALAVDPTDANVILAGTSSGIYRSLNGGASWSQVTSGFTYTDVVALAIDPNSHCTIYGGVDTAQSFLNTNAMLIRSTDCGATWGFVAGAPLGRAVFSIALSSNSATIYLGFRRNLTAFTTQDGIIRWTGGTQDFSYPPTSAYYTVAADPTAASPCTAYSGEVFGSVYQNTACAPTAPNWTQIGVTLAGGINTIAPHPTSSGTLLAGTTAGNIYRKASATSGWVPVAALQGSVNSIVYQPGNPSVVYAAGGGGVVYRSTDGGVSWAPTSTIGPAVASLAVSAAAVNNVYAGTYGTFDAFYTRMNPVGGIADSTLFGGHGSDVARAVGIDPSGNAVVVGTTDAADFPVSAGAVGATKAAGTDSFIARLSPVTPCQYALSATSRGVGSAGVSSSVDVTSSGSGCTAWTASSNAAWLVVTGGASGTGNGTVNYTVTANNTPSPRVGTLTIAGLTFTVTQVPVWKGSDVNGDGSPDLVWRNSGSGANQVWYLSGTTVVGAGNLPSVPDPAWQLIATADLNADGHPDAIWRNTTTGANVVWYLNGATVLSQASLPTVADLTWQLVASADVNQDGSPDLIWRNQVSGANLVWYLNGVTLMQQVSLPTVADLSWSMAASADMNGDGSPDLLWRNVSTGATVVWYLNGVSLVSQGFLPSVTDLAWTLATALDVNGDGVSELVWRHRGTGANVVWTVSGVTVTSQASLPTVPDATWRIAGPTASQVPSDVNGDQHPDLVWRNTSTGANVIWYLNGTTLLSQSSLPTVADATWQRVATADLNADGHPDLVWRNSVSGANVVWLLNGTTLLSQVSLPTVSDLAWQLVTTADINEDAQPDLIWRNTTTGANVVWYLTGTTVTAQGSLPTVSDPAWRIGAAADVNGDGHADLIWRNTATGANVVWYVSGPSLTVLSQGALPTVPDAGWQIALAADVNGDRHPDLVWRHTTTGANVVWLLNGTTFLSQASLPSVTDTNWTLRP